MQTQFSKYSAFAAAPSVSFTRPTFGGVWPNAQGLPSEASGHPRPAVLASASYSTPASSLPATLPPCGSLLPPAHSSMGLPLTGHKGLFSQSAILISFFLSFFSSLIPFLHALSFRFPSPPLAGAFRLCPSRYFDANTIFNWVTTPVSLLFLVLQSIPFFLWIH